MSILSMIEFISDNSKKNLDQVPEKVLRMPNLKMLYLEGNFIDDLPQELFPALQKLTWLDLRDNRLSTIPKNIAFHPCLETILLTNNKIHFLPNELGLVPNLKVVQVSGNPIKYPSERVLSQGVIEMCKYLREEYDRMQPISEDDNEEPEFSSAGIPTHDNTTSHPTAQEKKLSVQQLLRRALKRAMRQTTTTLPTIKVRALQQPRVAEDNGPETTSARSYRQPTKVHKLTKSCSKLSLHSSYNAGRNTGVKNNKTIFERVKESHLKDMWMEKLKDLLLDQERILQQEKNLKTLNNWRLEKKNEPTPKPTVVHTVQTPYDTNPEYNKLMSRHDLTKEIDRMIKDSRQSSKKVEVQQLVEEVVNRLKALEAPREKALSPRSEIECASKEIQSIIELHRKITSLQSSTESFD